MRDSGQPRTRVKMCGTTRLEDALAAVRYGVDGLGFIFYEKSPRYILPEQAARIIEELPPFIDRVGVFVNAPLEDLEEASKGGLSYLQLHGNESVEYCREVRERLPCCGIIKAFRVGKESRSEQFSPYNEWVDGFLLDTYVKGAQGGTGKTFDWSILDSLQLSCPLFLAGGLSSANVVEAIRSVRPFAVDVNSGVEHCPGEKDHALLEEFMYLVGRTCFN